jgi:hypothetical protein
MKTGDHEDRFYFLLLFAFTTAIGVMLALFINDLRHEVKRLDALFQSHEDILVPKHQQGSSAGPYKDGKPVK